MSMRACRVAVAAFGAALIVLLDYGLALVGEPRAVWLFQSLGLL